MISLLKKYEQVFISAAERDTFYKKMGRLFPLFKEIIEPSSRKTSDGETLYLLTFNGNWFWQTSNELRINQLCEDLDKVYDFSSLDTAFSSIISRMDGDAYGIVKPINRESVEPFDEYRFDKACGVYFISPSYKEELKKDGYYKLIYCAEHHKSRTEYEDWVACETMLGSPINFWEYKIVDQTFFGSPKEIIPHYGTYTYVKQVQAMWDVLNEYRKNLHSYANNLVTDIMLEYSSGLIKIATKKYKEFFLLFEPPEGCSLEEKVRLMALFEDVLGNLPASVKSDLDKHLAENKWY